MKKLLTGFVMIITALMFISSIVNAVDSNITNNIVVDIDIIDSNGKSMLYMPPESGGVGAIINVEKDYTNCNYAMYLPNNYGTSIETDFGTFSFKEKSGANYIYTCPVNLKDITNKSGSFDLIFTATNIDTNKLETLTANFLFYKTAFKDNANLQVGDTVFIDNGKVEKDVIYLEDGSNGTVVYDESTNTLRLSNYSGTINYSNMGSTFNIDVSGNCSYSVVSQDTKTGIKLDSENSNLPKTVELVVDTITEGEMYSTITTSLKNTTTKFYAYDISLQNSNVTFQPTGKVKISIPIPNDIDTSKLAIYRITENGEKTEYKATVKTIDNKKYATFETDHFSTYVLAETKTTSNSDENNTNSTNNKDEQKDNTIASGILPKTGVGIGMTMILIIFIVVTLFIYYKYNRYKDVY